MSFLMFIVGYIVGVVLVSYIGGFIEGWRGGCGHVDEEAKQ